MGAEAVVLLCAALVMLGLIVAVRFYPQAFLPSAPKGAAGMPPRAMSGGSQSPGGQAAPPRARLADLAAHAAPVPGKLAVQHVPLGALSDVLRGRGVGERGCLVLLGRDTCGYSQIQFGVLQAALSEPLRGEEVNNPPLVRMGALSRTTLVLVESSALGAPEHAALVATIVAAGTGDAARGLGVPMWLVVRPGGAIARVAAGFRPMEAIAALASELEANEVGVPEARGVGEPAAH